MICIFSTLICSQCVFIGTLFRGCVPEEVGSSYLVSPRPEPCVVRDNATPTPNPLRVNKSKEWVEWSPTPYLFPLLLCSLRCLQTWWRHKMKHFPRYRLLALCAGIHRSPVNSPHKGQWRGALMFSLICVWINGWVNNREAGVLRRHRPHYPLWRHCNDNRIYCDRKILLFAFIMHSFNFNYTQWLLI